jgi:hypothetical protein
LEARIELLRTRRSKRGQILNKSNFMACPPESEREKRGHVQMYLNYDLRDRIAGPGPFLVLPSF